MTTGGFGAAGGFDLDEVRRNIRGRLQPGEDLEDAIAGGVHLAERRARILGRTPTQDDLEFAFSAICLWPFKTPPPEDVARQLARLRVGAFRGAARGEFNRIDALIPTRTLRLGRFELAQRQQEGIAAFVTTRPASAGH